MDHMEYGLEFCEKTLMPIIKNVVDKYIGTSYSIEKKDRVILLQRLIRR